MRLSPAFGYPFCFALGILLGAVVTVSDFHSSIEDCTMEIEQSTDLRRQIINSVADEPNSTKALMGQFLDLGDRKEASLFLGAMFRDGLIRKQSNSYWKATTRGLQYAEGSGPAAGHEHQQPPEQDETGPADGASSEASELAAAKAIIEQQNDMLDDMRSVLAQIAEQFCVPAEPYDGLVDRVLSEVGALCGRQEASIRGTSPEPELVPEGQLPSAAIASLQDGIPENASLVVEHAGSFAVFAGQRFALKDAGDYEAFVRLAARHLGAVE